jgi:vitamin B12 transporter
LTDGWCALDPIETMTFSKFFRARLALAGFAVLAAVAANAQTPAQLPAVVTAATRTPAEPMTLGSAVERIDAAELARWQTNSLASALGLATGAPTARTGAGGAVTSLFLRGANSNQALFLVDGLRLNDPNTDYAVLLGGACLGACDSLEIAHGPQSTLYGGEAAGGVVLLRAERGSGAPAGRVSLEGGSFGTWQGGVAAQGERGPSAWSFSAQGESRKTPGPTTRFTRPTPCCVSTARCRPAFPWARRRVGFTAATAIPAIATPTTPTTPNGRTTCSRPRLPS